jgi:hypothetical protein
LPFHPLGDAAFGRIASRSAVSAVVMIVEDGDCSIAPASLPPKVVDPAGRGASTSQFPQELSFQLRILQAAKPMAVRNKWNWLID